MSQKIKKNKVDLILNSSNVLYETFLLLLPNQLFFNNINSLFTADAYLIGKDEISLDAQLAAFSFVNNFQPMLDSAFGVYRGFFSVVSTQYFFSFFYRIIF